MDWSGCPVVIARPGYVSGAPALRDDPRVPVEAVIANMDDDMTARDVAALFDLRTSLRDIQALYDYAQRQRAPSPV